jgi:hypothetical protein
MAVGLLIVCGLLYFIPTFMAAIRSHRNGLAIFALNLLLGWTLVGWIGALVWSLTYQPVKEEHSAQS